VTGLGFICGMPRSGTTWLGRVLASHPEIAVFGETDFWGRDYLQTDKDGYYRPASIERLGHIQATKDWHTTTGEGAPLPGLPSGEYGRLVARVLSAFTHRSQRTRPEDLFFAIAAEVATRAGKRIVVEKTPGHLLFINRIRQAYPEVPVVILKREPLGFVTSLTYRPAEGAVAGHPRIVAFAYHPAITSYLWRQYARSLLATLAEPDSQVLVVDYSALMRDPAAIARQVARHLGANCERLIVDPRPVNSSFAAAPRRMPPASTTFWLRLLARHECSRLYPDLELIQPPWYTTVASCLSLVPSVLVFSVLYRPRAAALLDYARRFAGAGRRRDTATRSSPN